MLGDERALLRVEHLDDRALTALHDQRLDALCQCGIGVDRGFDRIDQRLIFQRPVKKRGELRIGAREGRYPGMVAQREVRVRFIDGPRADAGTLEPAADVTVRYDGKAQVVRFPRTAR